MKLRRLHPYVFCAATLVGWQFAACKTPEILIDHAPHPCGEYPVDCGHGRCCPENNRCIVEADGTPACEFDGAGATLDAGFDHGRSGYR